MLVAAAVRLYRLGAESLWLDEAYSVVVVRDHSLRWLLLEHPTFDPHPPLHYVLLKLWTVAFGVSEVSVRLHAALLGVGAVAGTYYLADELFDPTAGTVAALLVAVSPFHVWHSQNVRMYSLLALLTVLSCYLLVWVTREFTWRRAGGYVVATALLGYTHVFALFVVAAQGGYLLTRSLGPGDRLALPARRWIPVQAGVGALLAPWIAELLHRARGLRAGDGSPISWIPEPSPSVFGETYLLFASGKHLHWQLDGAIPEPVPVLLGLLAAACVLLAVVRVRGPESSAGGADESGRSGRPGIDRAALPGCWLAVLLAVVPVAVPYGLSKLVAPLFVIRYTIPASIGFYLLVARGASGIASRPVRYVVVAVLVVGALAPLPTYYADDQREQWREAAAFVGAEADADDVVIVTPGWNWRPFEYYYRGDATVRKAYRSTSADELRRMAAGHDQVFLVFRYPDEPTVRAVRDAIEADASVAVPRERKSYIAVTVYQYRYGDGDGDGRRLGIDRRPTAPPAS